MNAELLGWGWDLGWRGPLPLSLAPHTLCPECRAGLQRAAVCLHPDGLSALTAPKLQEAEAGSLRLGAGVQACVWWAAHCLDAPAPRRSRHSSFWEAPESPFLGAVVLSWGIISWGVWSWWASRGPADSHTVGEAGKEVLELCPAAGAAAP